MAVSGFKEMKNKPDDKAGMASPAIDPNGKIQQLVSSVTQKVEEVASDVTQKAQDWAANVANKAQETATAAVDRADDGIALLGHGMSALGSRVRDAAPDNGKLGSAATSVADKLRTGGHYLEEHGIKDMGKDLTDMVRHYPVQSLLVSFGIGCLLGWTLKRS
jgi:ElaB/YqjD/DUF883 family membrane-anchored ribosome-binding protein